MIDIQFKENESNIKKQFKIFKTILQIMENRSYIVSPESIALTFQEFKEAYQNGTLKQSEVFASLEEEELQEFDGSIVVFYNWGRQKITQEYIKKMIQSAPRNRKFLLVVITSEKGKTLNLEIDKKAQSFVQELSRREKNEKSEPYRIELFKDEDLLFNVLKHELVPQHKVMSEGEKLDLLKKYKVKDSQLPKILLHDPVAKFLGLRRGQVVKITRKSETAGTYITYRITV